MSDKWNTIAKDALLRGACFTVLFITVDTIFHLELRWKQMPAWIIAGILFGISMYFHSRRSR